ncbi:hypothetical protein HY478_03230 [Candidatus Uhrbacteria bacterium]|nr:hypothetical protein [Candidatus Uhrbacteria bacterium]
MYYYIYDSFVLEKEYAKDLAAIENRLADFGITGNIGRLSLFRDAAELVTDEVGRGAKTIVAVGNDATVRKVMDAVIANRVAFGLIPLGAPTTFAKLFGVPVGAGACDVLARRRLLTIDVGRVNGRYFLSSVRIPEGNFTVECDGRFAVHQSRPGEIQIKNVGWINEKEGREELGDPQDGFLEAVIDAPRAGWLSRARVRRSTIPVRKITIESAKQIGALVDEEKYAHERFEIAVLPRRLRVVTGRERMV